MNEEAQTMLVEALTVLMLAIAKAIHYRYLRRKGYNRSESLRPWNPGNPPSQDDDAEPTPPQTPNAKKARNGRGPLV